jgi:ketosteroid isomerase-like protein
MYSSDTFRDRVIAQIELLNNGKPLDAFDEFVADSVTVYDNGALVASNAAEARARQVKALKSATDIKGSIHDLTIADDTEICVFRDKTALGTKGKDQPADTLIWQKWRDGRIVQQQSFDGRKMQTLIEGGILKSPDNLGRRR